MADVTNFTNQTILNYIKSVTELLNTVHAPTEGVFLMIVSVLSL